MIPTDGSGDVVKQPRVQTEGTNARQENLLRRTASEMTAVYSGPCGHCRRHSLRGRSCGGWGHDSGGRPAAR